MEAIKIKPATILRITNLTKLEKGRLKPPSHGLAERFSGANKLAPRPKKGTLKSNDLTQ
jgi:hypothetical protein